MKNEKQIEILKRNKSRGYSGYLTVGGTTHYCRSKQEAIYLLYIHKKFGKRYDINMESEIFYINEISYKPDFVLYGKKTNKIKKIFEVKSSKHKIEEKYYMFADLFEKKSIYYEIFYEGNKIYKHNPEIKEKIDFWLENSASINTNMKKENNPRYGVKMSEETKRKIGSKSKERFKNKDYKEKWFAAVKKTMTDEWRKKISVSKLKYQEKIEEQKNKSNPIEKRICVTCGKEFLARRNENRVSCKTNGCTFKYRMKTGEVAIPKKTEEQNREEYKKKCLDSLIRCKNINFKNLEEFELSIKSNKNDLMMPKNFGISLKTIIKYFESFSNLKNIYESKKNNKT